MIELNKINTREELERIIKESNKLFMNALTGDKIPQMKLKNREGTSQFSDDNLDSALDLIINE